MPSIIRVLDEHTINQIAAGEVIEHPASVVKELVENALDASAKNISIEILVGGRQLIRIIDDGIGMGPDDALLSIERHATSKIRSSNDLNSALTMGFRGEALASIASVSKMKILTKEQNSTGDGFLIIIEGGKILQQNLAPASFGTTIEIKSLFFNTPARRKFQKSIERDNAEIHKTVSSLALANPKISFQLICNQKLLLKTSAVSSSLFLDELQERIVNTLGNDYFQEMQRLSLQTNEIHLEGFISTPNNTRLNRSGQYLFVNKRPILCPLISLAILDGYGTLLSPRRYPNYVLHLNIPTDLIDVNVHPQKKEIRIRKEALLRKQIAAGVEQSLHTRAKPTLATLPWEDNECSFLSKPFSFQEESGSYFIKNTISHPPAAHQTFSFQALKPTIKEESSFLLEKQKLTLLALWPPYIVLDASLLEEKHASLISPNKYPLEGLLFIDQKTAHKRVLYDSLCITQNKQNNSLHIQELLIPMHFEFTHTESIILETHLEDLSKLGIGIRYFGNNTFVVDSLPETLSKQDISSLLHNFLNDIQDALNGKREKNHEDLLLLLSNASMKSMKTLSLPEAEALVTALFQSSLPSCCPSGKPIFFYLEKSFINKRLSL
ncbi:MAG: DNA mismatch repair endonuclease MutL [Chlamydiales bacterium]|nr:DNA mismatch repair endonuclease MutL [Chlamydiales bacterium]